MNIFSTNYGRDHLPCFHVHFSSTSSTYLSLSSLPSINYTTYMQLQINRQSAATLPKIAIRRDVFSLDPKTAVLPKAHQAQRLCIILVLHVTKSGFHPLPRLLQTMLQPATGCNILKQNVAPHPALTTCEKHATMSANRKVRSYEHRSADSPNVARQLRWLSFKNGS